MIVTTIRLTIAQRNTLSRVGHAALRAWLDSQAASLPHNTVLAVTVMTPAGEVRCVPQGGAE